MHGGAYLRSIWPAEYLAYRGISATVGLSWPEPDDGTEVVIIHRPIAEDSVRRVERLQRAGMRVLVQEDDDLSRIHQTLNPVQGWAHRVAPIHDEAMRRADGIIVSTPRLVEVYGGLNQNVWLCPNALPAWVSACRWYWSQMKAQQSLRVGWQGVVDSHLHDIEWIKPVMRKLTKGAIFTTIGEGPILARHFGVPVVAHEHRPFAYRMLDMYRWMSRADVGIVPLVPNGFNEAKSSLKALEYMTVGVPVVATDLPEQRALIDHGVDGFLASSPEEFADRVQDLLHDEELRFSFSEAARAKTLDLLIEKTGSCWEDAVLGRDRITTMQVRRADGGTGRRVRSQAPKSGVPPQVGGIREAAGHQ